MNHIYKLKFDKQLLELIVVSELVTNTLARTHLVTLSEDNTHHVSNNIASSIYSCSLAELIFSMASVTYSLEHTVNSLFSYYSTVNSSSKLKSLNSFYNFKAKFTAINTTDYHFTLRNLLALSLLVASVGVTTNVLASPTVYGTHGQEGTVVSGTVSSVTNGLVTTITNTPNAIIDWKQFNINQNEILKFVQKTVDSAVLNRVLGNQVSKILGTLQSNGQVFIVNPNGIVFGNKSHVDVGGLVASTFDINNNDFLHGHYVFNKDKDQAIAKVLNSGVIKIKDDGSLALIGGQVVNNGVLEAKHGTVFLLAGNSIEIADLHNPLVSYKVTAKNKAVNLGRVLGQNAVLLGNQVLNGKASKYTAGTFADVIGTEDTSANQASINADGQVVLFGGSQADTLQSTDQANNQVVGKRNSLVENNCVINVSATTSNAGTVKVLGDYVHTGSASHILAQGTDIANGGQVLIGGDATGTGTVKLAKLDLASAGSVVDVSAQAGNAGHVVFWGNRTAIDGNLKATSQTGKGGFIETSGHQFGLGDHVQVSVGSLASKDNPQLAGNWLIDPDYFAVVGSKADFNDHVKNQVIGEKVIFNVGSKTINEWEPISFDVTTKQLTQNSYITTEKLSKSFLMAASFSEFVSLSASKGLVFYNVSGQVLDNSFSHLVISLDDNHSPNAEFAIKNSHINNNNLVLTFGEIKTGMDQYVGSMYVYNSHLNLKTLEVFNPNTLKIINSEINTQTINLDYSKNIVIDHSNLTASNNIQFEQAFSSTGVTNSQNTNTNVEIINHSVVTSKNGQISITSNGNIILNNSTITSNDYLNLRTNSKPNDFSYLNITHSNLSSVGQGINILGNDEVKITQASYLNATKDIYITSSELTIDDSQLTAKAKPLDQGINISANTLHSNHANFTAEVSTIEIKGKNYNQLANATVKAALNVNINPENYNSYADITDSTLTSTASEVNIYGHYIKVKHTNVTAYTDAHIIADYLYTKSASFYNSPADGYLMIENSNITSQTQNLSLESRNPFIVDDHKSINVVNSTILSALNLQVNDGVNTYFHNSTLKVTNKNAGDIDFTVNHVNLDHTKVITNHNLTIRDHNDLDVLPSYDFNVTLNHSNLEANNIEIYQSEANSLTRRISGYRVNSGTSTLGSLSSHLAIPMVVTPGPTYNSDHDKYKSQADKVNITNSTFKATEATKVETLGSLDIYNSTITSKNANISLFAKQDANLTKNHLSSTQGGLDLTTNSNSTIKDNIIIVSRVINITSTDDNLVDKNSLLSTENVVLSTSPGKGTLYIGHNEFNGAKDIKVNANTTNPVVCLYGPDRRYNYTTYTSYGPLCVQSGNNSGNNSGSNNLDSNTVNVVTNKVVDDVSDDPHYLNLGNSLGDIYLMRSLDKRGNPLDLANGCRPKFIHLMNKYNINFKDIQYGSEQNLIYKYKLTIEQADFLFNCYARNIGYFNHLYDQQI